MGRALSSSLSLTLNKVGHTPLSVLGVTPKPRLGEPLKPNVTHGFAINHNLHLAEYSCSVNAHPEASVQPVMSVELACYSYWYSSKPLCSLRGVSFPLPPHSYCYVNKCWSSVEPYCFNICVLILLDVF